jgi:hypothetical protein
MKLTAAQQKGLDKLKAAQPFQPVTIHGQQMIRTGVNCTVLHSLRSMGLIRVSNIYLRGNTTPDLEIVT